MLEFDVKSAKQNKIELLDCQVDLILESIELICHIYKFFYSKTKRPMTKEENSIIALMTDTFEQILNQYKSIDTLTKIDNQEEAQKNFFKKFA